VRKRLAMALGAAVGLLPAAAPAQEAAEAPAGEAPLDTEALEGQIVIRPRPGERIEEYRVNGRLYMVKVIPRKGPPYGGAELGDHPLVSAARPRPRRGACTS